jgi:hypothetical protein
MPHFVTIRDLPGVTADAVMGAGARVKSCSNAMQGEGCEVRWVRSFFLPETSQTHCYFEAPNLAMVEEVNRRAQIPFTRIVEVSELTPDAV